MRDTFDYFIVFAEMRTGSNFLEANLNAFEHITCHGEAFNPHFIGYPNSKDIFGVTQPMREGDPVSLVRAIAEKTEGLGGFRFFHDHDKRVLDIALPDPRCAKIILTRNPVDSYVSWKIAQATGQWKLTDVKKRRDALAEFDRDEFEAHLEAMQAFQVRLLNALQVTGQTAFYVAYEDLQDVDVMNGLATYLGETTMLEGLDKKLKKQNPEPISAKVKDFEGMEAAVARLDRFNLSRTPNFEPRRGPAVPGYVACAKAPLLYLPVAGGPQREVERWMAALDGVGDEALQTKFNQKGLRQWMRGNGGHRSFAVLRHPVARAHHVFCEKILSTGPGSFVEIRRTLRRVFKLPIPDEGAVDAEYDRRAHQAAFKAYLMFLKANLSGQTSVRIDTSWATQATVLQGMGQFALPDFILRESELEAYLPALAAQVGYLDAPLPETAEAETPIALSEIYDDETESLCREAYQRDYLLFGFDDWAGPNKTD